MASAPMPPYGPPSESNSPRRNRMDSAWRTARSMSASVSRPCSSAPRTACTVGPASVLSVGEAVHPGLQGRGVGLGERVVVVLRTRHVVRGERVGHVEHGLVGPGADPLVHGGVDGGRPAVDQVVGRHDTGRGVRLDRHLERHVVVLVQQPRAQVGGGRVAADLVVVADVVLERGCGHQVGRVVTAHPVRVAGGQRPREEGVLGVALLVAARTRIGFRDISQILTA